MCTTISNGYNINTDMFPCGGSYSGVNVDAKISILSGTMLILNSPTFGSNAEIYINGGILKINGSADIPKDITVEFNGYLEVNGDLEASGSSYQVQITDSGKIKVSGDFISNCSNFLVAETAHFECLGSVYTNWDATIIAINGGSFKAKNASFNNVTALEGRVEVTATCVIGGNNTVIDCCKLTANTFLNAATVADVVQAASTGYIECYKFFGAQPLTSTSNVRIYKSIGGGNPGSATVLTSPISPSPC